MSREIKFRAWHKPTKTMIHVYGFTRGAIFGDSKDARKACWKRQECELIQYTGLKDKNDIEIFEGDILQVVVDNNADSLFLHVVKYDNCAYWIDGDFDDFGQTTLSEAEGWFHYKYEVVGNIYENPDLLESEQ